MVACALNANGMAATPLPSSRGRGRPRSNLVAATGPSHEERDALGNPSGCTFSDLKKIVAAQGLPSGQRA